MHAPDWQAMADKQAKKIVKDAYKAGNTVGYSLGRLLELGFSLKVIRAVYRG
jgi:hypothetical protein